VIRASEHETCRRRLGEDSRRQLNPRCVTPRTHSSLLPLAGSAPGWGGSCPIVHSPREEESGLGSHPGRVFAGGGCGAGATPSPPAAGIGAEPPRRGLQSRAPRSLCSSITELWTPPGDDSSRKREGESVLCVCVRVTSGATAWGGSWGLPRPPAVERQKVCLLQGSGPPWVWQAGRVCGSCQVDV